MAKVFISYSRSEKTFVRKLSNDLEKSGLDVWWDISNIKGGDIWVSSIESALITSQYCVIVLSKNSVMSEWVQREYTFAIDRGVKIIPIYYEKCDVPLALSNVHFINFSQIGYDTGYFELLEALGKKQDPKSSVVIQEPKTRKRKSTKPIVISTIFVLMISLIIGAIKIIPKFRNPTLDIQNLEPINTLSKPVEATSSDALSETSTPSVSAITNDDILKPVLLGKGGVQEVIWPAQNQNIFAIITRSGVSIHDSVNLVEKTFFPRYDSFDLVGLSPDGNILAISRTGTSGIELLDIESEINQNTIQSGCDNGIAFSNNNDLIALACDDGKIEIWDINGSLKQNLFDDGTLPESVIFSPTDTILVSGHSDGTIKVWDLTSGQLERSFIGHNLKQSSYNFLLAFDPSGSVLFSSVGGDGGDNKAKKWDINSGNQLELPDNSTYSIALSPNGKYLAYGSWGGRISVMDIESQTITELVGHDGIVYSLSFSPDNNTLISGSNDGTVRLWEIAIGEERVAIGGYNTWISSLFFYSDNNLLGASIYSGPINYYDLGSKRLISNVEFNSLGKTVFSHNGQKIASSRGSGAGKTINISDTNSGQLLSTLQGDDSYIRRFAFSLDNSRLVAGTQNGSVIVWEIANSHQIHLLKGHQGDVKGVAFSPDGRIIASGGYDNTVKFWDSANGQLLLVLNVDMVVETLLFSPDNISIAVGGRSGTIKLFDTTNGNEKESFQREGQILYLAFSPDGNLLASGENSGSVKIRDLENLSDIQTLDGHINSVQCLIFSPDGKTLASGSYDGTILLWNIP